MKKKLTIENFTAVIPWKQIEEVMGKREYKRFNKWMIGQTVIEGGVYSWDLERFLNNQPIID